MPTKSYWSNSSSSICRPSHTHASQQHQQLLASRPPPCSGDLRHAPIEFILFFLRVGKVGLTRAEQGWETERFEVGIGESHGEGFAPGEMPGSMATAGHVAQLPPDSQCDECRSPTPWCFPLAPEGSPQSQPDPASESDQHLGRLAKAEIEPRGHGPQCA